MTKDEAERVVREFEMAVTAVALPGKIAPEVYLALHLSVAGKRSALLAALTTPDERPSLLGDLEANKRKRWWGLR